jgi:diguanylate cyclase (GGDEF)-like protein/PAS domain S-box-containing protein
MSEAALPTVEEDEFPALFQGDFRFDELDDSFDRITRLLSAAVGVPHATIGILGRRHVWTLSSFGQGRMHSIDRTMSFCARVVEARGLLIVPDARRDRHHAGHPLLDRPDPMIFYAGVPLVMPDGEIVGSLGVHDRRTRRLSREQRAMLADCAAFVATELRLRREVHEHARAEAAVMAERSRLGRVIDSLPFDFWLCDAQGRYILQNAVGRSIWGVNIGSTPTETGVSSEVTAIWAETNRRALAGEKMRGDFAYQLGDRLVEVEEILAPVYDEHGQIDGLVGVSIDNSERKAAEKARREVEARLTAAVESLPFDFWICDQAGNYVMTNAATRRRWGELAGKNIAEIDVPTEIRAHWNENIDRVLAGEHLHHEETFGSGVDIRHVEAIMSPVRMDGQVIGLVGVNIDVTERKLAEQRLHHLAHHDVLTGLPNRRAFQERLAQAVGHGDRHGHVMALLLLDLDAFKNLNDTLGHDAGDALLVEVASRLNAAKRRSDTVARLGGDEFAVILDAIRRPTDAAVTATRILEGLARPFHFEGQEIRPRASIGITVFPDDASSAGDLLKHADIALYRAKEAGRGRWRFFDDEMRLQLEARRNLERELRRAVAGSELALFYQPVVRCDGAAALSFEATARWSHPSRGLLEAEDFLPAAEESGLIGTIRAQILRRALGDARQWLGQGIALDRIAVGLGSAPLGGAELYRLVDHALAESRVAPRHLEIGITEPMLLGRHGAATAEVLRALHDRGIAITLVDFGASHASLLHLRDLPIGRLRIGADFVRTAMAEARDARIVQAIIDLAHGLGIETVADGVALPEQLAFLARHGCDHVQGPLIGQPLPADLALEDIRSRPWTQRLRQVDLAGPA